MEERKMEQNKKPMPNTTRRLDGIIGWFIKIFG